jgi:predicted ester cyclase
MHYSALPPTDQEPGKFTPGGLASEGSDLDTPGQRGSLQGWFTMTTETQKLIERIPLEVFNKDNFGLIDELVADTFVEHTTQPGVAPTRAGFKQSAIELKKAFPDLRYTIEDSIESGDRIVHRLTARGTMKNDYMGMRATGKPATWTEFHIGRVVNGRLTEHWGLVDQLGLLVQLGVIQSPAKVAVAV